ncbi:MAG: M48 family metalloprotease [Deltaproteobacteria bacterium]|nr:M48 family metalloprotease [Deltaproteobacteria bacterium]
MSERHVWLALGLSCSLVLSACGGGLHGRVYRLPRACRGATGPDEVRRCAGRLLDDSIVARLGVYDDRELLAYVRRVGLRVARPSQRPADSWTFRILEDSGVGAWAAPDAHIYITRGLLAALDSEAELAAVLGHEVGHVVSGHTDTALDKLPELASGDWSSQFRLSRDDEAQADQLSVRYLRAAGYDPRAIRSALRTVYRVGGPEASYRRRPAAHRAPGSHGARGGRRDRGASRAGSLPAPSRGARGREGPTPRARGRGALCSRPGWLLLRPTRGISRADQYRPRRLQCAGTRRKPRHLADPPLQRRRLSVESSVPRGPRRRQRPALSTRGLPGRAGDGGGFIDNRRAPRGARRRLRGEEPSLLRADRQRARAL